MSLSEETQNLLVDLRIMCNKCNIPIEGIKAELVSCLEDFCEIYDDEKPFLSDE
ncbi:34353_t:CDS:2, partial [Racocetra persica]